VKIMGVEGVKPSAETIANQSYPLVAEVYAVTRAGMPADHPAIKMRDWWLSAVGQAAVAESGYVPLQAR
jgi:phosphate transport system substrate-binding protein